MMGRLTVAYAIRIATLAVMYSVVSEYERMDEWPDHVQMALNVRHPRSVGTLINSTSYINAITVPSRRDIAAGLGVLMRRSSESSGWHMRYLYVDALAWHVYIEDCHLRARPVWYKPPGRNAGIHLGEDPVADVLDYYERKGEQVLRALEDQLKEWRE